MTYVLRLVDLVGMVAVRRPSGLPPDAATGWVKEYDPNAHHGGGAVEATDDPEQAKQFPSLRAAMEEWRRVADPPYHYRPHDGRPNRPLTAFSVTPQSLDQARHDKEQLTP